MADDRGIYYIEQFHGETPIPAKIKFNKITLNPQYPFPIGDWEVTTTNDPPIEYMCITDLKIRYTGEGLPQVPPANLQLNGIWNVGTLEIADLLILMPNVNDKSTVIDLTLGINRETGETFHMCVDLQMLAINYDPVVPSSLLSIQLQYWAYLKYVTPGQNDVEWLMSNSTLYLYVEGSHQYMDFGIDFMYPFDRLTTVDNAIVGLFIGYHQTGVTDSYCTIPRTYLDNPTLTGTYSLTNVYVGNLFDTYRANLAGTIDLKYLADIGMETAEDYTSPEAGDPSDEGGYHGDEGTQTGGFDDSSDTIGVPNLPTLGVSNIGFVNVYKISTGGLQLLANELFPPLVYTPPTAITATDTTEAIINAANQFIDFLQYIPQFFNQINAEKYINYVLDCHIIPVDPGNGTTVAVQVGNKTLLTQGDKLSSDYVEVDCGSISLAEYYANFADFQTSFKLFLPFVGFVPARPEWFYRESIQVVYHFNIVDGSFVTYVLSTGAYVNNNNAGRTIVGQYGGNCCVHIPITGQTYSSMVSGVIGSGFGALSALASGNAGQIANSLIASNATHPDIVQSNQYSSSVSFLSCRRPFALIERPVSSFPMTYAKENGIPSNVSKKLGSVTGFNMIGDIHLDGVDATEAEKAELEKLLRDGIIL